MSDDRIKVDGVGWIVFWLFMVCVWLGTLSSAVDGLTDAVREVAAAIEAHP